MRNLDRRRQLVVEELEGRWVPAVIGTTSTNWSGYAVQASAGSVTAVSGSWIVPTVTGTGTAYSSAWVGIDGWTSSTVEQIGTDSDVVNGKAVYYAWYEMYPAYSVNIAMIVKPGDTMSASVTYLSTAGKYSNFSLQITDTPTSGPVQTFSTVQTIRGAQRSSAEWIQEAPSSNSGILQLANFATINFSKAKATIGGVAGPIDNATWSGTQAYAVNMTSPRTGATLDTISGLSDAPGTPATSSFSVTFIASSTPPPPPPHHHHWWWFAPNQTVTQDIDPAVFAAVVVAATPPLGVTGPVPVTATIPAPSLPAPQIAMGAPGAASFSQFGIGAVGGSREGSGFDLGPLDMPTMPDADDYDVISQQVPPSFSRAEVLLSALPSTWSLRESSFTEDQWQRADLGTSESLAGQPEVAAASQEVTGATLLALALSGYWSFGSERGPAPRTMLRGKDNAPAVC